MRYSERLKDPRWQRKRLEIMQRADFKCEHCLDGHSTLHVHHRRYIAGRDPWDYQNCDLAALCENCHGAAHERRGLLDEILCSIDPMFDDMDVVIALVAGYLCANSGFLSGRQREVLNNAGTLDPRAWEAGYAVGDWRPRKNG